MAGSREVARHVREPGAVQRMGISVCLGALSERYRYESSWEHGVVLRIYEYSARPSSKAGSNCHLYITGHDGPRDVMMSVETWYIRLDVNQS